MLAKALERYNFENPAAELIRHNENMTYKVTDSGRPYILRIHKPVEGFDLGLLQSGTSRKDLIAGEADLLQFLSGESAMQTQRVKLNTDGEPITVLNDGTPVTVLEWIEGTTLENTEITPEIAYQIGVMIGTLHNATANCPRMKRYRYDGALLSRMMEEATKGGAQGHFSERHTKTIVGALSGIRQYLSKAEDRFILVHADLGMSNLICSDGRITPIDFSLSGYGVPEMDAAFSQIDDVTLHSVIWRGYRSVNKRGLDAYGIEACFCLQILLFITAQHGRFADEAWFHDKLEEWCGEHFAPLIDKGGGNRDRGES